jgi:hypothetical protein
MQLALTAILPRMGPTDVNFAMCRTALKLRLPVDGAAIRHPMATLLISRRDAASALSRRFPMAISLRMPIWLPCFPAGQMLVLTVDSFNIS